MTSSTPERRLDVRAGGVEVNAGETAEVQGHGDLVVRTTGHPAHVELELHLGDRSVSLVTSEAGVAVWRGPGVLGQVAGELRIRVDDDVVTLRVRPGKLTEARMRALLADLEAFGEGLSQEAGGRTATDGLRSRDDDLTRLDAAVGRAAEAAPAIRRRPLHRARDVVRAAPRDRGASTAADVRWLATHPAHALRAEAQGREVGVVRERSADLDTAENRGVLSAYDQIAAAVDRLRDVVDAELAALEGRRPSRQAFLTEAGNLYDELDRPRVEALTRRRERLDALRREALALRPRSGLPDLRPRGAVMVRTPRVDAEPAYWATWRAFEEARTTRPPPVPARPAPVKSLDALWEQWCAVAVVRAVRAALGPPDRQQLVDPGWFATLRRGPIATWTSPARTVTVLYEPEIGATGDLRKLHPGHPWRPDLLLDVAWTDGTRDVHVLDAKLQTDRGAAPWAALQEVWLKYGDSIGDAAGWPLVRSVWALWPGARVRLVSPRMRDPDWPPERLRGGTIGLLPGAEADLGEVVGELLG